MAFFIASLARIVVLISCVIILGGGSALACLGRLGVPGPMVSIP